MMGRRKIREEIFKILFGIDFYPPEEVKEQIAISVGQLKEETESITEEDVSYISGKSCAVADKVEELDKEINRVATGWKTSRMGKAELTIIRLAVYEILYDEEVPGKIAVNEAVELAKKYGGEESSGFVNGVLAKIIK
jgi:N utilization substance protein B